MFFLHCFFSQHKFEHICPPLSDSGMSNISNWDINRFQVVNAVRVSESGWFVCCDYNTQSLYILHESQQCLCRVFLFCIAGILNITYSI